MDKRTSRSELNNEVYRDKNTLVEVTIHRKPKATETKSWRKNLLDSDDHFAKHTSSSLTRAKHSPKRLSREDKLEKDIKFNRDQESKKEMVWKDKRSIHEILRELRDIVEVSGIKDLHNFIEEFEAPAKPVCTEKSKQADITPTNVCQKQYHLDLEDKIRNLENECQKFRTEAGRYKHEYGVMVKQVEVSRVTVDRLEAQVADLKKIISRLTRNNGELLGIVSEKIKYEDMIADLEKKNTSLSLQLSQEKSRSSQLEQRLHSAQAEAAGLRSLSADLRAGLRHGLAGLELPRPDSRPTLPPLGDDTRNILGMKGDEEDHTDTDDSAFDDPNTESLKSRPKSVQNKNKVSQKTRPLPQVFKQIPPASSSQVFRINTNVQPKLSFTPQTKMATTNHNKPTSSLPPYQHLYNPNDIIISPNQFDSSTLVESKVPGTSPTFNPLPLDLSETAVSQLDGTEKQSFEQVPTSSSSPTTIILNMATESSTKPSLETKVSSFLARLHQDTLHLSIDIPQPQSFQGASMHLSMSSSDTDMTRETVNTTLTEGKFLKGLDTSIEVLQGELSKNFD